MGVPVVFVEQVAYFITGIMPDQFNNLISFRLPLFNYFDIKSFLFRKLYPGLISVLKISFQTRKSFRFGASRSRSIDSIDYWCLIVESWNMRAWRPAWFSVNMGRECDAENVVTMNGTQSFVLLHNSANNRHVVVPLRVSFGSFRNFISCMKCFCGHFSSFGALQGIYFLLGHFIKCRSVWKYAQTYS